LLILLNFVRIHSANHSNCLVTWTESVFVWSPSIITWFDSFHWKQPRASLWCQAVDCLGVCGIF
jgi:hypothetical protein